MDGARRAYCISNFSISDVELMNRYVTLAIPIVQQFGGRMLSADRSVNAVEGDAKSVVALIEFPSMAAAQEFWHSPEYEAIKQMRIDATHGGFLAFADGLPLG